MTSPVSLREVTASTVRSVTALKVKPAQERYVASNAVSIAEAYFDREAWFRAIYLDEEPAGFLMLSGSTLGAQLTERSELSIWRFMVDARFQKQGVGRKALKLVIEHARSKPSVSALHTSYVVGPASPLGFYLAFGFTETGIVKSNGEIELRYELKLPSLGELTA